MEMTISCVHIITASRYISVDVSIDCLGIEILAFTVYKDKQDYRVEVPINFNINTLQESPTVRLCNDLMSEIRKLICGFIEKNKWLKECLDEQDEKS